MLVSPGPPLWTSTPLLHWGPLAYTLLHWGPLAYTLLLHSPLRPPAFSPSLSAACYVFITYSCISMHLNTMEKLIYFNNSI